MATVIQVAVAVICHQGKFLLAERSLGKHQGGKLEFVGGKIEMGESETTALCREVFEELGLDIGQAVIQKLGDIRHDYGDKCVQLCVYLVGLDERYDAFKDVTIGAEGQRLYWYDKDTLLALGDRLPKANGEILAWLACLSLSSPVFIDI